MPRCCCGSRCKLLLPEDEGGGHAEAGGNLASAIKTILLADLVMSLDNVIAVAAAAKGSVTLLVIGLAISIPLVVFASTLLMNLMGRYPIIVTIGAALLGWVSGEMAISDPAVKAWVDANLAYLHYIAPAVGAIGVVAVGNLLAKRAQAEQAAAMRAGVAARSPQGMKRVLLAVDGSESAARAVKELMTLRDDLRDPAAVELHLVNVQRPLPGDVSPFVVERRARSITANAATRRWRPRAPRSMLPATATRCTNSSANPARRSPHWRDQIGADMIVMGTRGLGTHTGALLGSVAQSTLVHAAVPVLLAK